MCNPPTAQRGCAAFWGPTRPFLGGVGAHEAAGSHYLPTSVLLATRTASTVLLVSTLIYLISAGRLSMRFLTSWSFVLVTISFLVLTIASLLATIRRESIARRVAAVALPLHFVAASAALYITPVYFALLGEPPFDYGNLMPHGGTLLVVLFDFALGAALRFRAQYITFMVAYIAFYLVFIWLHYAVWNRHPDFSWPYGFLDFKVVRPASSVGYYFGLTIWCVAAAVIMLLVNRIVGLCAPNDNSNSDTAPHQEKGRAEDEKRDEAEDAADIPV